MATNVKVGNGALFKQREADRTSDSAPVYTGQIELTRDFRAGSKIRLAGWIQEPKRGGDKYISIALSIQEEDRRDSRRDDRRDERDDRRGRRDDRHDDDLDSEIPF